MKSLNTDARSLSSSAQEEKRKLAMRLRKNADVLIEFMRRLMRDSERKIFLILDNLRVHHSKKVRTWVEKHSKEIALFYLPPYSPELNPDEYLERSDPLTRLVGEANQRVKRLITSRLVQLSFHTQYERREARLLKLRFKGRSS